MIRTKENQKSIDLSKLKLVLCKKKKKVDLEHFILM